MYDARDLFAGQRGRPRGLRPGGGRPLPEPRAGSSSTRSRRRSPTGSASGASSGSERGAPGRSGSARRSSARAGRPGRTSRSTSPSAPTRAAVAATPAALALSCRPTTRAAEAPDELLDLLDGADARRRRRRRPGHLRRRAASARPSGTWPERDRFELALARAGARARHAGARDLPRDADAQRGLRRDARPAPARRASTTTIAHARARSPTTRCALEPGSLAARAVGRRAGRRCSSHHHQGVDRARRGAASSPAGPSRTTTDRGDRAARTARFALGVLWHPEEDERSRGDRRRSSSAARGREEAPAMIAGRRAGHRAR